jgi:3-isopropylmalate dehydratase small subunit
MKMTSPNDLVNSISEEQWEKVKGKGSLSPGSRVEPKWVEPPEPQSSADEQAEEGTSAESSSEEKEDNGTIANITSKVYLLGDFIDTDALAPAQFLVTAKNDEEFGTHCLEHTHPEFRQRVKDGSHVVVAGKAFGCGSSRMEAVQALLGVGIKCVIAKSFAFIYSRNQPSLGLLGITIEDEAFYEAVTDGVDIDIDLVANVARVGGKEFPFELSQMEKSLTSLGGVAPAFNKFGKQIFDALTSGSRGVKKSLKGHGNNATPLAW